MKRNGNVNTNRTFNPQNTKPPMPLDVDEVDAVLERFIRQKYDQQLFSSGRSRPAVRNDSGSTRSSDDQPPPLPPKPGKRFGFGLRSASSALPLQRSLPVSPHSPPGTNGFSGPPSPIRVNKQSRVFGASVGGGGGEFESKLNQLRDMGFHDEKRNTQVLTGLGGNLEKTIESLVRLGEGSVPGSRSRTPNPPKHVAVSQTSPLPLSTQSTGAVNGISFAANGTVPRTNTGTQGQQTIQTIDLPQIQSTRNFTSPSPYPQPSQTYNPFDTFSQQTVNIPLENAFQGMQISQQPLFPNATGGYPSQPPAQEARVQTMTPPVPPMPQQFMQNNPFTQQNTMHNANHNPYYQATQQHIPASSNPYVSNIPQLDTRNQYNHFQQPSMPQPFNNGFSIESPQTYSPQVSTFQQQPSQQQQIPENPQPAQQQQQQQQHQYTNPYAPQYSFTDPAQYMGQNQQQSTQQYNQFQPQSSQSFNYYQPQPLQPQQTGRIDKSSILALYNYPQVAPPPLPTDTASTPSAEQPIPNVPLRVKPTQRSVTMPVQSSSGSRNPFQVATATPIAANGNTQGMYRHASQESLDVGGLQNGRHSPDAFASLSARFVR
jgi:hypothetical protein